MKDENEQKTRDYASLWPPFSLAASIRPHGGVSGNMISRGKHVLEIKNYAQR